MSLFNKVINRISRFGVTPIHVFVFHHVSDVRDPRICAEQDWTRTDVFFSNLSRLQERFDFISLADAYQHIAQRRNTQHYAVLTTDDGLRSVPHVLPGLIQKHIPLTCFVNAKYLDGESFKEYDRIRILEADPDADILSVIRQQYMDEELLFSLDSPLLSIASHGYEHIDVTSQTEAEFRESTELCRSVLSRHPRYAPFYAYPWGIHSNNTDLILKQLGLIPVLVDGLANYRDSSVIHRECIDGVMIQ